MVPDGVVDEASAYRPPTSFPVWVEVRVVDASLPPRKVPGFALAWTREHVLVQIKWPKEYFVGARNFWTDAVNVSRRVIEPSWPR